MAEQVDDRVKVKLDIGEGEEVEEFSLSSEVDTDPRSGAAPQGVEIPILSQVEVAIISREMEARLGELREWLMHHGTGDKVAHSLVYERMIEVQHVSARLGAIAGGSQ